ncbi:unnamed protein product [Linum tenue]|uniref:Transcription initiation factor IIF subunit alpha n=1 Tax=Linum tenue TaxID=586396 RepID=A0AAV0GTQ2_9ROSI|nr:unnamed protein product [Linum tenue]
MLRDGPSSENAVTEAELRAVLMVCPPITTINLVGMFKSRLRSAESRMAFAKTLKRISKLSRSGGAAGTNSVVLRNSTAVEGATSPTTTRRRRRRSVARSGSGPVTEEVLKAVLMEAAPITSMELVALFKSRLKSSKDKKAFAGMLRRISRISKGDNGANYVVLRSGVCDSESNPLIQSFDSLKISN